MHTPTESTQLQRRSRAISAGAASGLALYLLTLCGEALLGAGVRWLLVYLGAETVGAIIPLGLSAEALGWIAAAAPLLYSALGLARPGRGRLWCRRLGARRPSAEEAIALEDALALLRSFDSGLLGPGTSYILDDPLPGAAVRGQTLILSRGLLESESLAAVLAHELGHANSLDGRLTEALNRLQLWGDPLAPLRGEGGAGVDAAFDADPRGGLLWALLRWTICLAGGSSGERLLGPLWAAHWRAREYAADAYAASLGQAEDLARHLIDQEQPFDAPQPSVFFNRAVHPPVALRVERLGAIGEGRGSK